MDWLDGVDYHWMWLVFGLLLAAAEMLVPGVFLMWLAGAAILTGIIAFALPVGLPFQLVIFAVMSILAVFTGRRYLRENPVTEADPMLNKRGAQLVGETATVTTAIDGGRGRIKLGDSEWMAKGADTVVGARVRVVGHDGSTLLVEPVGDQPGQAVIEG